ncbi:MAG TPA: formylmethanofuran dehydrogenase subunit E family protein, partial [Blastocatellia bacterium]|nr:formylmethanofuran dehydrogenase subunit E family protein [Blastocatellia bacterium]
MESLDELLKRAEQSHGHMCAGQVLGVRLAMLGCRLIGIDEPRGRPGKKLLVFVEIDRCAADAIQTVTGCRLGKRTLKYYDYGKLAATFLNTETGNAFRVVAL